MSWNKNKKKSKRKKIQNDGEHKRRAEGHGPRQAIPPMSRFDSPAGTFQTLDFPSSHHAEQQSPPTFSPGQELTIRGAVPKHQARYHQAQNRNCEGPNYDIGGFEAPFGQTSERGNENTQGAFIHPSRLGLIGNLPLPEKQVPSTPEMSPGVMIQPRINPFQTNLGGSNHGTPSNNHVSSRHPNHSASNSRSTNVSLVKKEKEVDDEAVLPPLVDAAAPDRSKIVVARQFLFQHELESAGLGDERDVNGRLMGISLIEGVRRVLRM
jgi:hypothetical protein